MARGSTLIKILTDYRALARLSLNPANNPQVRDTQVNLLQRTQEWLWDEFDWPHMRVQRQFAAQTGQRYYAPPSDVKIERINKLEIFRDGDWCPMWPEISGPQYSTYNSDLDERTWPPANWQLNENENLELWPIPDQNADDATREGYIKIWGIRNLQPFVADDDVADLDDRLIVGYAAAETLAATGAKDAKLKLDQANALYARLRGALTKRKSVRMFGIGTDYERRGRFEQTPYKSLWGN